MRLKIVEISPFHILINKIDVWLDFPLKFNLNFVVINWNEYFYCRKCSELAA